MRRKALLLLGLCLALAPACVGPRRAAATPSAPQVLTLPSGAQVAHAEALFTSKDGLHLFRQSWRPEGKPVRAVVVLVHGLRDHSGRYEELAEALVQRGFAVHAFDLRGHGRSAGIRAYVNPFEQYLDDLNVFLRTVGKEESKPVYLFGHSMGATVVMLDLLRSRPPVAGVILSAGLLKRGKDISAVRVGTARVASVVFPHLDSLVIEPEKLSRDPEVVTANRADPLVFQDPAPARTASNLLSAVGEVYDRRAELPLPLLALHGTADEVTDPDGSRELVASARAKDKTLKLYDGDFHDLLHEPDHARVIADIVEWLDVRAPEP